MLYMTTLKSIFHCHHMIHPADAVFLLFSILFILIPFLIFLYAFICQVLMLLFNMNAA